MIVCSQGRRVEMGLGGKSRPGGLFQAIFLWYVKRLSIFGRLRARYGLCFQRWTQAPWSDPSEEDYGF